MELFQNRLIIAGSGETEIQDDSYWYCPGCTEPLCDNCDEYHPSLADMINSPEFQEFKTAFDEFLSDQNIQMVDPHTGLYWCPRCKENGVEMAEHMKC